MPSISLFQHYFDYLRSPPVLLTILIIVGPVLLEIFKNKKLAPKPTKANLNGCFRLGIRKRSNLDDQHKRNSGSSDSTATASIKALFTYPVKSCRGIELAASEIGPTGLKYDRLFTFAQLVTSKDDSKRSSTSTGVNEVSGDWRHEWRFITQREFPRLALVKTELWAPDPRQKTQSNGKARGSRKGQNVHPLTTSADANGGQNTDQPWIDNGGCLIISFLYEPDFNLFGLRDDIITVRVPLSPTAQWAKERQYTSESLTVWRDSPKAINITNEIPTKDLAKLKYYLGVSNPLGLFRVDHNSMRSVTRSLPEDIPEKGFSVGFADAFPFHLLNLASVHALDDELPKEDAAKGKLDAKRFRANVIVAGPSAHAEDSWKKVSVGRCIMPRSEVPRDRKAERLSPTNANGNDLVETDGHYHVACRTARCKLPNVDPDTGIKDANEPSTTLAKTRKVDKGADPHPVLGMQMIPLFQQGILRIGDEVKVLERGEHVYEKMFS